MITGHASTRKPGDREAISQTCRTTHWLGLKIIKTSADMTDDNIGYVEFAAFYTTEKSGQLHERSRFIRESGRWYYLDGEMLPPLVLKRNAPCWCLSGKKYKRCHGNR